jgi:hypothetical protein
MLALPLPFLKLPVKSTDARLMKAEHNQSCGLPFIDARKNSPRLFTPKKFHPTDWPLQVSVAVRRTKRWNSTAKFIPLSIGRKQRQN